MEVSKINRIKNTFLESGELRLNLVLRETMIDCDRYRSQQGRFRKVLSGFQSFFYEIMQDKSNIIFQVTFYLDWDSNNLRKWKNIVMKSRCKALNWILGWDKTAMIDCDKYRFATRSLS